MRRDRSRLGRPIVAVVTALAGLLAVWMAPAGGASVPNPIPIGVVSFLTGTGAQVGKNLESGVRLRFEEINQAGGVLGSKLEVIVEDDAGKPEQSVNAVTKLVTRDKVVAVIGSVTSPTTLAGMEVSQKYETPQITPVSTSPKVTGSGNKWIFRVAASDKHHATTIPPFLANNLHAKKLAIIHVNDDYGVGGAKIIQEAAPKSGIQVVAVESYLKDAKDFTAQISKVKEAGAEALVIWGRQADGALVVRQVRQLGLKIPILGGDAFSSPLLIKLGGDDVEGVYFTTTFLPTPEQPRAYEFDKKFRAKFNRDPDFAAAQAYDAAGILAEAITRAGSPDHAKIRDEIAKSKDFPGVIGNISFDATGDLVLHTKIGQVKGGKQVLVVQ